MHENRELMNQHKIDQDKMKVFHCFYKHIDPVDIHVHDQYDRLYMEKIHHLKNKKVNSNDLIVSNDLP
jgi:hypothetical protein